MKLKKSELNSIDALVRHLSGDKYDKVSSLAAEIAMKDGKSTARALADAMEKLKIPNKPKGSDDGDES